MRAVAYLRVSQKDENIENQKMKIEEFARQKGFEIVGLFKDIDVSGTIAPRKRPQYNMMLEFCKTNNIKVIIFYDLSRLARDVIEGLNELKQLTDEGYNVYFAGMDFLNYDIDPMLKKKIIMDFLWFAELYVEDIRKRTKVAMERLKREGRVYHRPSIYHYIALELSGKDEFSKLTKEDIELGKKVFKQFVKQCLDEGNTIYRCWKKFRSAYDGMIRKHKGFPKTYVAFYKAVKRLGIV